MVIPVYYSKNRTLLRLGQLERDDDLLGRNNRPMLDYIDLGHMKQTAPFVGKERDLYYLPYHLVIKMETRRAIYDASTKTSSGSNFTNLLD